MPSSVDTTRRDALVREGISVQHSLRGSPTLFTRGHLPTKLHRIPQRFVIKENTVSVCKYPGCNRRLSSSIQVNKHFFSQHLGEHYKCVRCDKTFTTYKSIHKHCKTGHKKRRAHTKQLHPRMVKIFFEVYGIERKEVPFLDKYLKAHDYIPPSCDEDTEELSSDDVF